MPEDKLPEKVGLDYVKSNHFRVIHADGVYGGVTPNLRIHMAFWSQRWAIPQHMAFKVGPEGHVSDEEVLEDRISKDGLVRELEADVVFDLQTAKQFRDWLSKNIDRLEKRISSLEEPRRKD